MNIPNKVTIGYKEFKVNLIDSHVVDGSKVCYGNIEYDNGNINLSTLYDVEQQKCTFVHECLHGIDEIVESELTENQIRLLAKGLYTFIKDNPKIFEDMIQPLAK